MSSPIDDAARQTARLDLARNVVVAAGAGTGKTTLLTDRILFLLFAGGPDGRGLKIAEIVALTFTDKAAGEIRERLTGKLIDLLFALEGSLPEGKRKVWAEEFLETLGTRFKKDGAQIRPLIESALDSMDRSPIGTIHSFASQVLRLFPLEAGVDPGFEIDEGDKLEAFFDAEWARWAEGELGEPPADRDELKRWSARKELWLELLAVLRLDDLRGLAESLCQDEIALNPIPRDPEAARSSLSVLAEETAALAFGKPPKSKKGDPYALAEKFEELAKVLHSAAKRYGDKPLPEFLPYREKFDSLKREKWPAKWEDMDEREIQRQIAVYNRAASASRASSESDALLERALSLLKPLAARVRSAHARRGFLGYHGLLETARSLVVRNRVVREALKKRFKAVLIDEFQDTDPVQGELLLFLGEKTGRFAKTRGEIEFEPGKLFIVGDPKQSIYRFRGADPRAYEDYQGLLLKQGAAFCALTANFRSHAGVLGPVNELFSKIMEEEKGLQPCYEPISPRPGAKARAPGFELLAFAPEKGKLKADDSRAAEANWIAAWLSEHCGEKKEFGFGETAILLRSGTKLSVYLEPLKAAGIPFVVEAERYFYETQEVIDFVNLLRVLDDPKDRLALTGLLRSPLAALDDGELYHLAEKGLLRLSDEVDFSQAGLKPDSAARAEALFSFLLKMRRLAGVLPLRELVSKILEESFLLELCPRAYQGDQSVSNLMKFARMAADAGESGASLKEFIASIVETIDESASEGESPLADESLDAVRIMTIHKAKGLEFPVVFVPDLGGTPGKKSDAPFRVDWGTGLCGFRLSAGVQDNALVLIESDDFARSESEALRLLYVAMTRAKEHLILLGGEGRAASGSFAAFLAEGSFWNGEKMKTVPVEGIPAAKSLGPRERTIPIDPQKAAALWNERAARARAFETTRPFASPSALAEEREKKEIPDEAEPSSSRAFAVSLGVVCHRVLEFWDFKKSQGLSGESFDLLLEKAAAECARRTPGAEPGRLKDEAALLLEKFLLSEPAQLLGSSEILARELPFVCPYRDGRVLRGSIDILYRDPKGRLTVGDYKTGGAENAEKYALQGAAYAEAVEHALGETPEFRLFFLRDSSTI